MRVKRQAGAGQESVWDYPRPPRVEPELRRVLVVFDGATIVDSRRGLRVLETSHPPGIYVPFEDVAPGVLRKNARTTICEWKCSAEYWDVCSDTQTSPSAAWSYPAPRPGYEDLAGFVSFYPGRMDSCLLGTETVTPQPGDFYGGWITPDVVGPFKGAAGTSGW